MSKGQVTRERILAIAQTSVLAKGFGATSIEEIIAEAGITKSGFFYHFRDKNELARQMLRRFVENNDEVLDATFGRGQQLSDDPLQAFLIGLKLFAETLGEWPGGHPGCLLATICYQERLFDREVLALTEQSSRKWGARFASYLEAIVEAYPPREAVDINDLAEMLLCIVDGGIILSKIYKDPSRLQCQILAFRSFVKLVFSPALPAALPRPFAVAAE